MAPHNPNQREPSITVQNLSYKFQDGSPGLNNVNLNLPPGSRTLLIGGKYLFIPSTLILGMNPMLTYTQQTARGKRPSSAS